ncbi:unnamed protein product, partial [Effrenium voratum]
VASAGALEASEAQLGDLKAWSQMCLELSRCERSCPLHELLDQPALMYFKDHFGLWIPREDVEVCRDQDLPERSFWLLAPLEASGQVAWSFLAWSVKQLRQFLQSSKWQSLGSYLATEPESRPV